MHHRESAPTARGLLPSATSIPSSVCACENILASAGTMRRLLESCDLVYPPVPSARSRLYGYAAAMIDRDQQRRVITKIPVGRLHRSKPIAVVVDDQYASAYKTWIQNLKLDLGRFVPIGIKPQQR